MTASGTWRSESNGAVQHWGPQSKNSVGDETHESLQEYAAGSCFNLVAILLKHLHTVDTCLYCPQASLRLHSHCGMNVAVKMYICVYFLGIEKSNGDATS